MSDRMRGMPFDRLLNWVLGEYREERSIFGIPEAKFFRTKGHGQKLFGQDLTMPIGPAAGPHTQLAQNIVSAYLTGSRYFELKTVQVMDRLEFPKPCIQAEDECYNTEWSQELSIQEAYEEYVKAWFLLHVLAKEFSLSEYPDFIFNMSVGYTLDGIKTAKVDGFIEGMKDAAASPFFQECLGVLKSRKADFSKLARADIDAIPARICGSITLSTMHGCPPHEIEAISRYLLKEKGLHTFVKMNPTLLGFSYVRDTLKEMGFGYMGLKEESFTHDLGYEPGVAMLRRLLAFSRSENREFGVKLSNTLPVKIINGELPGDEMYMSGRSLYPLTIHLAAKLSREFAGKLPVSFSGGADVFNVGSILAAGIRPVTFATTLLKPGGYLRIRQMAQSVEKELAGPGTIDIEELERLAASAITDNHHQKDRRPVGNRKITKKLPAVDCFIAPCREGCPIGQYIPEYIRQVGEGRFTDAFQTIIEKNPLPHITGEICDHGCMAKCTRLDYDQPVAIRRMKKIAAEKGSASFSQPLEKKFQLGIQAAVIGAGPSGLAAAWFLAEKGFQVTVFDHRSEPGGTVQHVIPGFRISREAIAADMALIRKQGVHFRLGVDADFSLAGLKEQGFKYIYLALGAPKSQSFELAGDVQILPAISFLEDFKKQPIGYLGKRVAVIGGGNSAMDAARAAVRVPGVEEVTVIYRRTRDLMPAHLEEIKDLLQEGVILAELLMPVSYSHGKLRCQKMALEDVEASGRREPVPVAGAFVEIPVDTVIPAIGELTDASFFRKLGLSVDSRGQVLHDPQTLETSVENVYLGGDCLQGPSTIVSAISQGRRAADGIFAKEGLLNKEPSKSQRPTLDETVFQQIQAKKGILSDCMEGSGEAGRCLECHLLCNICAEVCPNRANMALPVPGLRDINQIVHLDRFCNQCGNCASFCPYDGAPYRDKLTLFASQADFQNSSNMGFCLLEGKEGTFAVRTVDGESLVKIGVEADSLLDEKTVAILRILWEKRGYLF